MTNTNIRACICLSLGQTVTIKTYKIDGKCFKSYKKKMMCNAVKKKILNTILPLMMPDWK